MRKAVISLGVIVFVFSMLASLSLAAEKLAFVDLSRIFNEYTKTKDYDKALASKEGTYSTQRDKKVNEVKQFQDKMNLLQDKQKEEKKPELETKIKELQDFDRQVQTDLRKEQDEKMKELLKDIEEAVKQYAEKEGYTLVFNDRVLVYQAKKMDISGEVIKILNKSYKE
ncbi:MAG: OmpH family outer membrane protein [Candidatus Omnitrophica bacterium]|nr:OmpH family outer membrane protein [Candidatus Omnitrophota bacterium]MBU4473140.1 OmpH family outer membrane protein [Candidatus Omnitrophota bacterium]MCG2706427.1 OmpH family outer membrane protein [Candidatus Omnitrophota bacterium]